MILEAIVTTRNTDGSTNIAPMGPHCIDRELGTFELRPFQTSRTWQNLQRERQGVLHVTDDVLMFAQAATHASIAAHLQPAARVNCERLSDCCRCYEFEITWMDASRDRAVIHCRTIHAERIRDFLGFNRGRHAVIEASILASRIDFLPAGQILSQFSALELLVVKTGSKREREAFDLLKRFLADNDIMAATDSTHAS